MRAVEAVRLFLTWKMKIWQGNMALLRLMKPEEGFKEKNVNYPVLCERKSILATMFWQMAVDNVTHNGCREIILVC